MGGGSFPSLVWSRSETDDTAAHGITSWSPELHTCSLRFLEIILSGGAQGGRLGCSLATASRVSSLEITCPRVRSQNTGVPGPALSTGRAFDLPSFLAVGFHTLCFLIIFALRCWGVDLAPSTREPRPLLPPFLPPLAKETIERLSIAILASSSFYVTSCLLGTLMSSHPHALYKNQKIWLPIPANIPCPKATGYTRLLKAAVLF